MDAQELIEATTRTWNERDRTGYLGLYTDDCEIIAPGFTGRGHEELGAFYDVEMTALPDNRITVLRTAVGDEARSSSRSRSSRAHTPGRSSAPTARSCPPPAGTCRRRSRWCTRCATGSWRRPGSTTTNWSSWRSWG